MSEQAKPSFQKHNKVFCKTCGNHWCASFPDFKCPKCGAVEDIYSESIPAVTMSEPKEVIIGGKLKGQSSRVSEGSTDRSPETISDKTLVTTWHLNNDFEVRVEHLSEPYRTLLLESEANAKKAKAWEWLESRISEPCDADDLMRYIIEQSELMKERS